VKNVQCVCGHGMDFNRRDVWNGAARAAASAATRFWL